jgi:hypothetical protein
MGRLLRQWSTDAGSPGLRLRFVTKSWQALLKAQGPAGGWSLLRSHPSHKDRNVARVGHPGFHLESSAPGSRLMLVFIPVWLVVPLWAGSLALGLPAMED